MAAEHERLHEEDVVLTGGFHHGHSFPVVQGQRLLTQHVLARFRRRDCPPRVHRVGGSYVDRLHVMIGQQCPVAVMSPTDTVLLAELLR